MLVGPVLLAVLLLSASPSLAVNDDRLIFAMHALAPGELVWGAVGIGPGIIFGQLEYRLFFSDGEFALAGTSAARLTSYDFPGYSTDGYLLEPGSVHVGGHLRARWTHEGVQHTLDLMFQSGAETSGLYLPLPDPIPSPTEGNPFGVYSWFFFGGDPTLPFFDMLDPANWVLNLKGSHRVDGARQAVSGKALVGTAIATAAPDYSWEPMIWRTFMILLNMEGTYAAFAFSECRYFRYEPQDGGWTGIWIPAAKRVTFKIEVV